MPNAVRTSITLLALVLALIGVSAGASAPSGAWPSLQEQLVADCINPASPMADLVRDNQEFWMLRPGEFVDKIGIPLWLRVSWRKAHPEGDYSGDDPTGGYPLVLREVAEWMTTHQDLTPSPPPPDVPPGMANFFGMEAVEEEGAVPFPDTASVGTNVRNSGSQTSSRSESDIRINYWAPALIISASNNISASGMQAQFYSSDGGATWGQTSLPLYTGDAFHSDPTVEWASNGSAWSTTLGINSTGKRMYLRLYKSTNNGATWTFDSTGSGSQNTVDKQQIWIDHSACSPYKDRLYVIWHAGNPAYINSKSLSGTWGAPIQVSGGESSGTCIGSDIKTNAYGDVFGFWPTTGNSKIFVVKSTNGGTSFGTPVQVATTYDSYDIGVPSFNGRRALIYVTSGAYRTVSKNMVYAVWTDLSGAAGCNAPANEPGSSTTSTCKTRIWFSRSTDGGATWSAKLMLNNQSSLNDQYNPWLAVDESTGALGVMYYDTVADSGRRKTDIWFQSSCDDGATWSSALKITTAMTDETVTGADSGNQYGDYNGMSAYAGLYFPVWTDRRSGGSEEIWTAKVTDCVPPGPPPTPTFNGVTCSGLTVNWTAVSGATSYDVYRTAGTTCTAATKINLSTITGTAYSDSGLSASTQYSYYIVPKNATCANIQQCVCTSVTTSACATPPLRVPYTVSPTKITTTTQGTSGTVTWDTSNCSSTNYHIIYGKGENLSAWTVDGGKCSLGASGSYSWTGIPDPSAYTSRFLWFLVVGDNGGTTEGSWGLTSAATERGGTSASGQCSCTTKDTSGSCGTN